MSNLAHLFFKFKRSEFTPMLSPTFPPYHVLGFSPKTLRLIFQKTGFRVLDIEHVNYSSVDLGAFKNAQFLKGLKSIVGLIARFFGHGVDVYGIPV